MSGAQTSNLNGEATLSSLPPSTNQNNVKQVHNNEKQPQALNVTDDVTQNEGGASKGNSGSALQNPASKPDPPTPPPSTKRWTWEYVPADDGKNRRRQTTPELDAELLLSQGRRTRTMARVANRVADNPTEQNPTITQPQAGKKRKAPTPPEDEDDDVVDESVRIAKRRKVNQENTKTEQKTHRVAKPKAKAARVPRQKKAHRITKPKVSVARACELARAARKNKSERRVRIAQSAVREMEQAVDERQDDPEAGYAYHTEPERRHGIMLRKEFYDPFRQAFSLNFIWPTFNSSKVQNALKRDPRRNRRLSIYDILPKDLSQGILQRMPQRDPAIPEAEELANKVQEYEARKILVASETETPVPEDSWEGNSQKLIPDSEAPGIGASSSPEIRGTLSEDGVTGPAIEANMTGIVMPKIHGSVQAKNALVAMQNRTLADEGAVRKHVDQQNVFPGIASRIEIRDPFPLTNRNQVQPLEQDFNLEKGGMHIYGSTDDDTPNSDELATQDSRASWGPEMDEDEEGDSCWEREEDDDEGDETDEEDYRAGRFVIRPHVKGF